MIGKVQVRADLVANVTKPQWVADRYKVVATAAAGMAGLRWCGKKPPHTPMSAATIVAAREL